MTKQKLLNNIKNALIGGNAMMINYFAMQIEKGWITIEQVPKRYRAKVKELIDETRKGLDDSEIKD